MDLPNALIAEKLNNNMDTISLFVGSKIEELREIHKVTQEDLALAVGLSRPSIVNMENGRQNYSLKNIYAIAEYFNISVNEILPDMKWYKKYKGKKIIKKVIFEIED